MRRRQQTRCAAAGGAAANERRRAGGGGALFNIKASYMAKRTRRAYNCFMLNSKLQSRPHPAGLKKRWRTHDRSRPACVPERPALFEPSACGGEVAGREGQQSRQGGGAKSCYPSFAEAERSEAEGRFSFSGK